MLLCFFPFCYSCRFLHLAIIHEDDDITQHLIELFPKGVLDIQNNLYQVKKFNANLSTTQGRCSFSWNFSIHRDFLIISILIVETVALFIPLNFQRTVVPLYLQPVLSVSLSGTSLWVVPVLAHKGLRVETPLLYLL